MLNAWCGRGHGTLAETAVGNNPRRDFQFPESTNCQNFQVLLAQKNRIEYIFADYVSKTVYLKAQNLTWKLRMLTRRRNIKRNNVPQYCSIVLHAIHWNESIVSLSGSLFLPTLMVGKL